MNGIEQFRNIHSGQTMLLVGNGDNLKLTPPEWFSYPSIGMNTIHLYNGWMPTYYTAVDNRLPKEFGADIVHRFEFVPKFVPAKLRYWQEYYQSNHFYYFKIRPGVLWSLNDFGTIWQDDIANVEMTFSNIMHVAIKLAYFMGAVKILIIGMEHKSNEGQRHFWGIDDGMPNDTPLRDWFEGYRQLTDALQFRGVQLINISPETYVPQEIISRGDWHDYARPQ